MSQWVRAARKIDHARNNPTMLDLWKVKVPGQPLPLGGVSLVPLLRGQREKRGAPMCFWQMSRQGGDTDSVIMDGDLKEGTTLCRAVFAEDLRSSKTISYRQG
jgi:hypothetical protein